MKMFSRGTMLLSSLAVVLSLSSQAFAEDKKKPELQTGASAEMLANACSGCHGENGASKGPAIPTIAGGAATYFVDTMEGYKSGDIPSTIMGRIAKGYSSEEIKLMGGFYEKQKFVAATGQESDADLAKKGAKIHKKYCEKCHSEQGTLAEDESGFLTGQWKPYLAAQLMDYQKKDRQASKKMAKKFKKMYKKHGDDGLKALVEFYSK
jgi:sulfide dehydrogenase cytochrome subunit